MTMWRWVAQLGGAMNTLHHGLVHIGWSNDTMHQALHKRNMAKLSTKMVVLCVNSTTMVRQVIRWLRHTISMSSSGTACVLKHYGLLHNGQSDGRGSTPDSVADRCWQWLLHRSQSWVVRHWKQGLAWDHLVRIKGCCEFVMALTRVVDYTHAFPWSCLMLL